ncbi:dUTP diphosphatase [Candidatus Kaiserbacteria bacterium CG_4_8_14_3_um_filter_38_9]|uniref:dUTP diphosphatase n=1 Tax=Candidatus Kaiserbacteria bacterium CG_4_8_14_3_um_filter_38_9 TaxID=1974599 RepID=A0A2M7IPT8_9BACT|nr:MAG: dUTP diphosphatase [Candidatus Kaiserbacteria bacterium CG_4_8_14_3_um_filter_38_9]
MKLLIKKINPLAITPQYAHHTDAAMDLYTTKRVTLLPGEHISVPTGIAVQIPDGYVGLIWDKSGLSHKAGLKTLGGVIDAGYRGEILVGILNTSDKTYIFEVGQKIAQMLIQKVEYPEIVEVAELDNTERGDGAFGSTGE